MLREVLVAFLGSLETFVEPLAVQARTLEHKLSVELLEGGACAGILCKILDCKSYFSQDAVQFQSFIADRVLEFERGKPIRRCHGL